MTIQCFASVRPHLSVGGGGFVSDRQGGNPYNPIYSKDFPTDFPPGSTEFFLLLPTLGNITGNQKMVSTFKVRVFGKFTKIEIGSHSPDKNLNLCKR